MRRNTENRQTIVQYTGGRKLEGGQHFFTEMNKDMKTFKAAKITQNPQETEAFSEEERREHKNRHEKSSGAKHSA